TTAAVPAPGTYRFRATLPGYYPAETGLTIDQSAATIALDLRRKSRLSYDFTLTQMSFPGIADDYQILPETLFARVSFETYLIGAIPFGSTGSDYDQNGSNRPFFISLGSSSFGLSAGTYLTGQHGFWGLFRPFVAAGFFLRVVTIPGYWGIDPLIPWGAQAELGLEVLPESRLRGIIAFTPRLYRAADTALAASNIYDPNQFWLFSFLDGYILQIPNLYVGVRFQP
ncbi:MAG TPA: hypothetical protein VMW87_03600, partial [Spirochaetia bacterium]|nr:hypothetical protein [Spirochaetia bacterium]